MSSLSLVQRLVLGGAMISTVAFSSGCKSGKTELPMYNGSSSLTEDQKSYDAALQDHYLSNLGMNPRNQKNHWQDAYDTFSRKKTLLEDEGKLTPETELAVDFPMTMSLVGIAYANNIGYDKAKSALRDLRTKHAKLMGTKVDLVDNAEKFVSYMEDMRSENLLETYLQIRKDAANRMRKMPELTQAKGFEIIHEEFAKYCNGLDAKAAEFGYTPGQSAGWADEAKDIAVESRMNLARWVIRYANTDPKKKHNNYEIAERIYDGVVEQHPDSRLAPRAILEKADMYQDIAELYLKGSFGGSPKQRRNMWNISMNNAKKVLRTLTEVPFRSSKLREQVDLTVELIEKKQADIQNLYK